MDISSLLAVLGASVDGSTLFGAVRKKLSQYSAMDEYLDLLDAQFENERKHSRIDIKLNKQKMKEALQRTAIDFKKIPLLPDQLNAALNDRILVILTEGGVVDGSDYDSRHLDIDRAKTILKRVHDQYFERLVERIPELVQVIQHREISERLGALTDVLQSYASKLNKVADTTSRTAEKVEEVTQRINEILEGQSQGLQAQQEQNLLLRRIQENSQNFTDKLSSQIPQSNIQIIVNHFMDEVPQFGSVYSNRTGAVGKIIELLNSRQWVAIRGEMGTGKTGLASLVYKTIQEYPKLWISFVGQENDRVRQHLRHQIILKVEQPIPANIPLSELIAKLASLMPRGVIFLDNLPDPSDKAYDAFYRDLQILATSLTQENIRILSTSQRDLPSNIVSHVEVEPFQAPSLTDKEILEALQLANAPFFYQSKRVVTAILTVTSGLPSLAFAYIRWYSRNDWPETDFVETLLNEEPGLVVKEESQRRVLKTLNDNALELLLRLSLLISDFDSELVEHIAKLENVIPHPKFALDDLKYICLTQLAAKRFQVSPLFKGCGRAYLSEAFQYVFASSVADFYLNRGKHIYIEDVFAISMYLWNAQRYTEYTTFLTTALIQITNSQQAMYLGWAVHVPDLKIGFPVGVSIPEQLILRTQQFRVALLKGEDVSALSRELDRLVSLSTDNKSIVYAYMISGGLALSISPLPASFSIETAIRRTFKAIQIELANPNLFDATIFSEIIQQNPVENYPFMEFKISEIIWFFSGVIHSVEQATMFLQEIYNTTQSIREHIFALPIAAASLPHIVDQFWMRETDKPEEERNWDKVQSHLDRAIQFADTNKIFVLKVAAIRAKAISLSYATKSANSSKLLEELLPTENKDLAAWINISIALMHNDYGEPEIARTHLETGINLTGAVADQWRVTLRKHLVSVYSKLYLWNEAKSQAHLALKEVELASYPEYSRLEILGELAFIYWNQRDTKRVCGTLFSIFQSLQGRNKFSEAEFNEIYHKFSNAISWYKQKSQNIAIDDTHNMSVEAGYFMRSWPKLRNYVKSTGNTLVGPAVPLLMMAVQSNTHGLAWHMWQFIRDSSDLEGTLYKSFVHSEGASLEARFGTPKNALHFGISSLKLKAFVSNELTYNGDIFQQVDSDKGWNKLDDKQKVSYESLLAYEVLMPLVIETIAHAKSTAYVRRIFEGYKSVLSHYRHLRSVDSLITNIDDFENLLFLRIEGRTNEIRTIALERSDLPARLILHDVDKNNNLQDKLAIQLAIARHFWETRKYYPIKHTMYGFGRFLYSFWLRAIQKQRFLFSSPIGFEETLLKLSPRESEKTVANILRLVSGAMGVPMDDISRNFIREILDI